MNILSILYTSGYVTLFTLTLLIAVTWSIQIAQRLTTAGKIGTPNGLGTPLRFSREAAYSLPDDVPVLFFTHGDDTNIDGEAAVFRALWWGREHRIVQGGSLLILPPHSATLMATLQPIQAWEELQEMGLAQEVMTFPRREGLRPFVATHYDSAALESALASFTPLATPVQLVDGTELVGWKARRVGPRLRISTVWRVNERPAPGTLQQFHHLRLANTPDSEPPLAISDVPISPQHWQTGDHLVVMGDFFVDDLAQEFRVDVGHYTLTDLGRIPQANGTDGLIRLGPFGPLTNDQREDND